MFQLGAVTPESTPQWLKPRAYWKRILSDNLKWYTTHFVDNPSPVCAIFGAGPRTDNVAPWQEEFLAFTLGWGVLLGHEEWRKAYRWKLRSTLGRTDGKSGWPRQWCTPYYMDFSKDEPGDSMYTTESPPGIWFKSWRQAWEHYRSIPKNEVKEPFPDKTSWAQDNSEHYLLYTRGVLALATHLGVAEAREPFLFVDNMVKGVKEMTYKWAIAGA
jgi:hypothetical protein